MIEAFNPYTDRVVTIVGGKGALGSKVAQGFEDLGFGSVKICGREDPFLDFVRSSTDLFFAVDDKETAAMLRASRQLLKPEHSVLDGSSVKAPLIPLYGELDRAGISVCSTHLGA